MTTPPQQITVIIEIPARFSLPPNLKALLDDPTLNVVRRTIPNLSSKPASRITHAQVVDFFVRRGVANGKTQAVGFAERALLALEQVHPDLPVVLTRCGHSLQGCRCTYAGDYAENGRWMREGTAKYWTIPIKEVLKITSSEVEKIKDYRTRGRVQTLLEYLEQNQRLD